MYMVIYDFYFIRNHIRSTKIDKMLFPKPPKLHVIKEFYLLKMERITTCMEIYYDVRSINSSLTKRSREGMSFFLTNRFAL